MKQGTTVVVDIGKTLSKVTLWSDDGRMIAKLDRPNQIQTVDGINRLDEAGIGQFVLDSLETFAGHPVRHIVPVAHGAALAAIAGGCLAFAPIDYEAVLPANIARAYAEIRAPFAETGSPLLPAGLNFGAQLYWAEQTMPEALEGATLLPWAQYWAWFLSGVMRSEVTSLGCHSDLWNPQAGDFSSLAKARGWAARFAPFARADEEIGTLRPEIADASGLPRDAKVLAGLHDSNAALMAARGFPQIRDNEATILSTGTWFIAMRLARTSLDLAALPEQRDCLVNVSPFGEPIPSARFMGGREIERLIKIDTRRVDIKPDQPHLLDAVSDVIDAKAFVMPTLAPGNGPFPEREGGWVRRPEDWYARRAGACLYAAMVANAALDLVGSCERILVEGRFAEAEVFVRAIASLRPDTQIFVANAHNDVSFGALRLINPELEPSGDLRQIEPLPEDIQAYAEMWAEEMKETV